jgi:hypothetical protein
MSGNAPTMPNFSRHRTAYKTHADSLGADSQVFTSKVNFSLIRPHYFVPQSLRRAYEEYMQDHLTSSEALVAKPSVRGTNTATEVTASAARADTIAEDLPLRIPSNPIIYECVTELSSSVSGDEQRLCEFVTETRFPPATKHLHFFGSAAKLTALLHEYAETESKLLQRAIASSVLDSLRQYASSLLTAERESYSVSQMLKLKRAQPEDPWKAIYDVVGVCAEIKPLFEDRVFMQELLEHVLSKSPAHYVAHNIEILQFLHTSGQTQMQAMIKFPRQFVKSICAHYFADVDTHRAALLSFLRTLILKYQYSVTDADLGSHLHYCLKHKQFSVAADMLGIMVEAVHQPVDVSPQAPSQVQAQAAGKLFEDVTDECINQKEYDLALKTIELHKQYLRSARVQVLTQTRTRKYVKLTPEFKALVYGSYLDKALMMAQQVAREQTPEFIFHPDSVHTLLKELLAANRVQEASLLLKCILRWNNYSVLAWKTYLEQWNDVEHLMHEIEIVRPFVAGAEKLDCQTETKMASSDAVRQQYPLILKGKLKELVFLCELASKFEHRSYCAYVTAQEPQNITRGISNSGTEKVGNLVCLGGICPSILMDILGKTNLLNLRFETKELHAYLAAMHSAGAINSLAKIYSAMNVLTELTCVSPQVLLKINNPLTALDVFVDNWKSAVEDTSVLVNCHRSMRLAVNVTGVETGPFVWQRDVRNNKYNVFDIPVPELCNHWINMLAHVFYVDMQGPQSLGHYASSLASDTTRATKTSREPTRAARKLECLKQTFDEMTLSAALYHANLLNSLQRREHVDDKLNHLAAVMLNAHIATRFQNTLTKGLGVTAYDLSHACSHFPWPVHYETRVNVLVPFSGCPTLDIDTTLSTVSAIIQDYLADIHASYSSGVDGDVKLETVTASELAGRLSVLAGKYSGLSRLLLSARNRTLQAVSQPLSSSGSQASKLVQNLMPFAPETGTGLLAMTSRLGNEGSSNQLVKSVGQSKRPSAQRPMKKLGKQQAKLLAADDDMLELSYSTPQTQFQSGAVICVELSAEGPSREGNLKALELVEAQMVSISSKLAEEVLSLSGGRKRQHAKDNNALMKLSMGAAEGPPYDLFDPFVCAMLTSTSQICAQQWLRHPSSCNVIDLAGLQQTVKLMETNVVLGGLPNSSVVADILARVVSIHTLAGPYKEKVVDANVWICAVRLILLLNLSSIQDIRNPDFTLQQQSLMQYVQGELRKYCTTAVDEAVHSEAAEALLELERVLGPL